MLIIGMETQKAKEAWNFKYVNEGKEESMLIIDDKKFQEGEYLEYLQFLRTNATNGVKTEWEKSHNKLWPLDYRWDEKVGLGRGAVYIRPYGLWPGFWFLLSEVKSYWKVYCWSDMI